jgi:anti-sigma factor ChrR (cupin superfamily)
MTDPSEHVAFETLNDYVDGRLDAETIALVDSHLVQCSECASELASLEDLLASTALLTRSVLPEDDLWTDLKATIDSRKDAVLPAPLQPLPVQAKAPGRSSSRWANRFWLAAAAVVLIVASSATTALVLRRGATRVAERTQFDSSPLVREIGPSPMLPGSFRVAEGQYVSAIEELRVAVDAQRSQLNPETVRTVDRSLAVVDSAIAEAREALLADPNNRTLVDLLSTSYQRKLDLLRRASELTSRI